MTTNKPHHNTNNISKSVRPNTSVTAKLNASNAATSNNTLPRNIHHQVGSTQQSHDIKSRQMLQSATTSTNNNNQLSNKKATTQQKNFSYGTVTVPTNHYTNSSTASMQRRTSAHTQQFNRMQSQESFRAGNNAQKNDNRAKRSRIGNYMDSSIGSSAKKFQPNSSVGFGQKRQASATKKTLAMGKSPGGSGNLRNTMSASRLN